MLEFHSDGDYVVMLLKGGKNFLEGWVGGKSKKGSQMTPSCNLNVNKHKQAIFVQCVFPNGKFLLSLYHKLYILALSMFANDKTPVKLLSISVTTCDGARITSCHCLLFS